MPATHQHSEAFALMQYEADDGSSLHVLWNSRDGVTPFVVTIDGVEHRHVRWGEDIYAPDYRPADDDRVFVTVHRTLDEWRDIARRQVKQAPEYAPPEGTARDAFIDVLAGGHMVEAGERGTVVMVTGAEYRQMSPS